jgi:hypothetical protein
MVRLRSDLHPLTVDKVLEQLNVVSFQLLSCLGTLKMGGAVSVQQQRTPPSQSWLCCRCMYACKFLSLESQTCIRCCQPFPSLLTTFIIFISITKVTGSQGNEPPVSSRQGDDLRKMRLLNVFTMKLEEYFGSQIPEYGILSHCV